jgi:hypothetical protein
MQKGAKPTYFREPHIICQRAACGSRAAVWSPLVYSVEEHTVLSCVHVVTFVGLILQLLELLFRGCGLIGAM